MLEQMMRAVARKIIAQEYPHAKSPAVVYATCRVYTSGGRRDREDGRVLLQAPLHGEL